MSQVIVKGITQKGKNRVREHGPLWNVISYDKEKILLESIQTGYLKWGFDPDFEEVQ